MSLNVKGLTIPEVRKLIGTKQASAVEICKATLDQIAAENPRNNALITVMSERALRQAVEIDQLIASNKPLPSLAGVPISVKDVINIKGVRNTCGSRVLENFISPYTATAVERIEAAGAVVIGKANCDEFAMGSSNENSAYGVVRNPIDLERVPGGSSGGSAASVAAGMCVASFGSDTGGSVRQPASFCGIVGLMPTYGRVSRYGLVAYASSLDHIAPLTRTVEDSAAVLGVMAGPDRMDSTAASVPVPDYLAEINGPIKGFRIGVPKEYFAQGLSAGVRERVEAGIRKLTSLGCEAVELTMPHTEYAVGCYYIIATAEASANLARYDGVRYGFRNKEAAALNDMYKKSRHDGFGSEVKHRIMLGTYVLSAGYYDAYYRKAQRVRSLIAQDFSKAFEKVDAIVTPVAPTPAFKLGEKTSDPLEMYLSDIYTITGSLAGVPGISVPCGTAAANADGTGPQLPVGMQIFARHFDEARMLRLAHQFEKAGGFTGK